MTQKPPTRVLEDFELTQYVHAFVTASNRVRYFILAITVTSIVVFVGHRNSQPQGWTNSRVNLARVALRNEIWKPPSLRPVTQDKPDIVKLSTQYAAARNLNSQTEVAGNLAALEQAQIDNIYMMKMPFLGMSFDVNDLGILSGIGLSVLMLTLMLSMARQHHNLYLCLWKVRQLCKEEDSYDDRHSKANLLYHALAMAQLFSMPPTLARWRLHRFSFLPKLLFVLPLIMQGLIFFHDLKTLPLGLTLNPRATITGMTLQGLSLLFIGACSVVTWIYSQADDIRWKNAFFAINPGFKTKEQPSWLVWTKLREEKVSTPESSDSREE